jgi:3-methyladenine DNA glycosylase AlkD
MASNACNLDQVISELRKMGNPKNVAGMARFGISAKAVLGISMAELRGKAKALGRHHALARQLWFSGIYEARLLGIFVAEPKKITRQDADRWIGEVECWADCDGLCIHVLRKTVFAHQLAVEWSERQETLVKRAGFTMMAALAVHDKVASNEAFQDYLWRVEKACTDERNEVKKGVNWALRQIGKRNRFLRKLAMETARRIRKQESSASRWIANDAIRELNKRKALGKRLG